MLDPDGGYKPLDVGNGIVAGSVAADGRLLALGGHHPRHGYVTLGGAPPFPDDRRHDQAAVRAYRQALADRDAPGFGLRPDSGWQAVEARLDAELVPAATLRASGVEAAAVTWAPPAARGIVQRWTLRPGGDAPGALAWSGQLMLGPAAITELTEGGVLPQRAAPLEVGLEDGVLVVAAPEAGVAAACAGLPPDAGLRRHGSAPAEITVPEALAEHDVTRTVAWALAEDPSAARHAALRLLDDCRGPRPAAELAITDPVVARLGRRAVTYILGCCTVPVGDTVCLVTDHRILPLAWNRDAYWMAAALLAVDPAGAAELVRRHLRWAFEVAGRVDGAWARAYLPSGAVKDAAFQLDQQCYPFLELADYTLAVGDAAALRRHLADWDATWQALAGRRAPDRALFTTDESPGDDPVAFGYHCSSHILLWHTLRRLAAALRHGGVDPLRAGRLEDDADAVRRDALEAFTVGEPPQLAYAVDLAGGADRYHDANDLPTAFAPAWGFVDAADPRWRETIRTAFSPANARGFFPGRFGGLGSVHTPGAWPLGDVQQLLVARLLGDEATVRAVLERLAATACWDDALPEARDPDSGAARSRHWFAWPGAALLAAWHHGP